VKIESPEEIVIYTIIVTLSFYIIALFSSSFFIKFFNSKDSVLHKETYDEILDYYANELDKREKVADSILDFLEEFQKDEDALKESDQSSILDKVQDLK
jgi:hypothetical protein